MSSTTGPARVPAAELKTKDPYAFHTEDVENPPQTFRGMLRRIGPGIILSASIVGSGELIATTTLGAEVGYVALWVILISCAIKPAVQSELGRYTIATGETGLAGFNEVPGPRLKVNWIVWLWAVMVLVTMFQIGAMFGGVAQVLNQLMPSISVNMWVPGLALITLGLLLSGGYERVERLATIKVALFTMLTFLCALMLLRQPEHFNWAVLSEGLSFRMPPQGLASAVAVFGITGVGASELFMYPYWCVEKGYARYTGPRDGTPAWSQRAHGWIGVMNLDILASMVIYTVATVAFYLLGAGILHSQGLVPASKDMIPVLSRMYTQTLGGWSLWLFYAGAIATLYGTIFAATAANSRVFADMARLLGFFPKGDYDRRVKWRNGFVWALIVIPVGLFYWSQSPVWMVKLGGMAQASMLPVIAIGTLYLRFKRMPHEVRPGRWITASLVFASAVIVLVMAYYAVLTIK
ncbi:MAG TPA: Nramp family divalent metal transporter [Bryobacteraceae bacterium]|nr:Nramp family divalent metal transporter [Bryobacteraceae bacterium]